MLGLAVFTVLAQGLCRRREGEVTAREGEVDQVESELQQMLADARQDELVAAGQPDAPAPD